MSLVRFLEAALSRKNSLQCREFFVCSARVLTWWWESAAGTVLKENRQYPDVQVLKFWYSFQSHAWSWACTKMTYDALCQVTGTKCPWISSRIHEAHLNLPLNRESKDWLIEHWEIIIQIRSGLSIDGVHSKIENSYIATSKIGMELVAIIFVFFCYSNSKRDRWDY